MDRLCPRSIKCEGQAPGLEGDFPVTNYSAEYNDGADFTAVQFINNNPYDPGAPRWWSSEACNGQYVYTSFISQEDADAQAQILADACAATPPPVPPDPNDPGIPGEGFPPPTLFANDAQTCNLRCPSGELYSYTIPAGRVTATSKSVANQVARQMACNALAAQMGYSVIGNDEQVATETCAPGYCPNSVTKTVPVNTYTRATCSTDPAVHAQIKAQLNAQAFAAAQTEALSELTCVYGNDEQASTIFCPGDPGKTAHVVIPACRYSSSDPSQVAAFNQQARMDLVNELADALAATGCACQYRVSNILSGSGTPSIGIATTCPLQFQVTDVNGDLIAPPNLFVVNPGMGVYDFHQFYNDVFGFWWTFLTFTPFGITGPSFSFYYGPDPTP